jgi:hypothetical protein
MRSPEEPDEGEEQRPRQLAQEEPGGEDAEPAASDDSEGEEQEEPTIEFSAGGQTFNLTKQQIAEGFMRQADYTRKTQQLAVDRNELADAQAIATALDRNPVEALPPRTLVQRPWEQR